jgi:hypothetical protein
MDTHGGADKVRDTEGKVSGWVFSGRDAPAGGYGAP